MNPDIFERLARIFAERRNAEPSVSYTARLFAQGSDAILKKIGEETAELILASKNNQTGEITHEAADLVFHTLMLLAFHGLSFKDVKGELERREGVSGIAEKASRPCA